MEMLREVGTDRRVLGCWMKSSIHGTCAYGRETVEWLRTTDRPVGRPPAGLLWNHLASEDDEDWDEEEESIFEDADGSGRPMMCNPAHPIPETGSWEQVDAHVEIVRERPDLADRRSDEYFRLLESKQEGPQWYKYAMGVEFWPAYGLFDV